MKKIIKILFVIAIVSSTTSTAQRQPIPEDSKIDAGVYSPVSLPKQTKNPVVDQISTVEYAYMVFNRVGWENILTTVFQIAFLVFLMKTLVPSLSKRKEIDNSVLELIQHIYEELLDAREGQILSGKHIETIANKYSNRLNVELSVRVMRDMIDATMYETLWELYKHKCNSPDDNTTYVFDKIYKKLESNMTEMVVLVRQFKFMGEKEGREINLSEFFNDERVADLLSCVRSACAEHHQIDRISDSIGTCFQKFKTSVVDAITTV